jgi:hypothetical protein
MTRLAIIGLAIGAIAFPAMLAPSEADAASCHSRKATGTVVGGLGGALVGNAISKGGGGLLVGGLGGALIGRQIGKSGCHRTRTAYYDSGSRMPAATRPAPVRQVYYDHMGNPVARGAVRDGTFQQVSSVTPSGGACRNATISYYDDRSRLAKRDVQICPR